MAVPKDIQVNETWRSKITLVGRDVSVSKTKEEKKVVIRVMYSGTRYPLFSFVNVFRRVVVLYEVNCCSI